MVQNQGLIFKKPPTHHPELGVHLVNEIREFDINQGPPPGGLVTRNLYASLDPYMRGRMRDSRVSSYSPPYELDKPITAYSLGQILSSDNQEFQKGDIVWGILPVEEYSSVTKEALGLIRAHKVDNSISLPLSNYLSIMGMTGLTAYSSLFEIGEPKKGETIFISSAAGAVGQVVGQIAKHEGLNVIGSVGDDKKLAFIIDELGFDGGFNYKKEKPADALKRLAPNGLDIYYENVGGEQLEAALDSMNTFGRIVACGMISQYNLPPEERYGIRNIGLVVVKRLKMQGFIVNDANMGPKYLHEHNKRVSSWLADGSIKSKEHITEGIENAGDAFVDMLKGGNFGKAILKIADPK